MTGEQIWVFGILAAAMMLFLWGRWRHDVVAFAALLAGVLGGVVPAADAFAGFGHPAVFTVAAVLVLSRALQNSGAMSPIATGLSALADRPVLHVAALTFVAAGMSAFMNNVGALALLMPVAITSAIQGGTTPSLVLMPLSFGSILGGLMTLIGTPPNIIVATYRRDLAGEPFAMFDFAPMGCVIALAGCAFVALIGWRLIPKDRKGEASAKDLFQVQNYVTEVRLKQDSPLVGKVATDLEELQTETRVIGLIRKKQRLFRAHRYERFETGDVLILQVDSDSLGDLLERAGLELVTAADRKPEDLTSEDFAVAEVVVAPGARIEGSTANLGRLRTRYGLRLLAIAREGKPFRQRLGDVRFRAGDILLLQGRAADLPDTIATLGCLPLASRGLALGRKRGALLPLGVFAGAVALTAFGVLPVQISFGLAALAMLLLGALSARELYEDVDWSVIVLLGAMIAVGDAFYRVGAAELLANAIVGVTGAGSPLVAAGLLLVVTMTLSDFMNNAATAVIMAPIGAAIADRLEVATDPFLMTVAIGASCAFLTPIGHQNNVLVMGPGGYRFSDYWRMGLPLEVLIVGVSMLLLPVVWPF